MLCFFTEKCARLYCSVSFFFGEIILWVNLCGGERLSVYYLYAWEELSSQAANHYAYTSIRLIAYFVTEIK